MSLSGDLSPLREIERAVQERAKDISVDMSSADGAAKLQALIDEEVARWSADFKRGRRDLDLAEPDVVGTRAFRNLAGYGPLDPLLADSDVWEIIVNGPEGKLNGQHQGATGQWRLPRGRVSRQP